MKMRSSPSSCAPVVWRVLLEGAEQPLLPQVRLATVANPARTAARGTNTSEEVRSWSAALRGGGTIFFYFFLNRPPFAPPRFFPALEGGGGRV